MQDTGNLGEIFSKYSKHQHFSEICNLLRKEDIARIHFDGLSGSAKSIFAAAIVNETKDLNLFLLRDKDEAGYFYNDLVNCFGDSQILFFPSSYKRSAKYKQPDNGNIILRTNVLNSLAELSDKNEATKLSAIISYPEAIIEKVIPGSLLRESMLDLHKGEKISIDFIHEVLDEYQFEYVDFVYEPGQFAIRGSILDIFSFTAKYPYRIDFFGDEVESIRSFDVDTQLSQTLYDKITILPDLHSSESNNKRVLLFNNISVKFNIWCNDISFFASQIKQLYKDILESEREFDTINSENKFATDYEFLKTLNIHNVVEFGKKKYFPKTYEFVFDTELQPTFHKNFTLLGDNLILKINRGYDTFILSENEKQIERLKAIFNDTHKGIPFKSVITSVHEGFIDESLKLCCYTDHQIFDRYHKYRLNTYYSNKASVSINELKDLKPGDYVVHIDHGIGRFGGLEKQEVNGKVQEAVRLVYRDNDILFVPIQSLHRISKYKGKDDREPKIYKLGSGAWQKLKSNTKKKVKDIAKDLIALYAQRKAQKGYQFSPDSYLQEELEASFIYEDTPDQLRSTQVVKKDLESTTPMDRLICGDVGFGKTEIAIRAAFKVVSDSKQVAILVPTTILALQHYRTFSERLKDFPCNVEYVSRLKKASEQKSILKKVREGKVDILIGTHRLLGRDIKFKDLGLLIIDEEQKFGVSAKEKLKSIRINVDTLTLTATPIPRTLQFSLMGARDLSVINTPPPNRHPIITELHTLNEDIIKEGIEFEVQRGGQVFFINNRIQNIYEIETLINKLCPQVKTIVGHGQMEGPKLEKIMIDFISGDYDVLVATTIIESGLDIPNANTIFINNAHNFGLSDLHQLRGRVGRSNKKAFCYLLAPPLTMVTPEARRRLIAIEEFSDLGSGFHIALQDLDIRGAGNMLGAEQSGFIGDIGFETYNRILDEALQELKENEFKQLYNEEPETDQESIQYVQDCVIETDLEAYIPDNYVANVAERIKLYRELDNINEYESLIKFRDNLIDRFGKLPSSVNELLNIVKFRWLAIKVGFERIIFKNKRFIGYFVSNQDSLFYQSDIFARILKYVQNQPRLFRIKEDKKLSLSIESIETLNDAQNMLSAFLVKHTKENEPDN